VNWLYNNLQERADCQNTRKPYKTSQFVGWENTQPLLKTGSPPALHLVSRRPGSQHGRFFLVDDGRSNGNARPTDRQGGRTIKIDATASESRAETRSCRGAGGGGQASAYLLEEVNDCGLIQLFMMGLVAITLQTVITGPLTNMAFTQFLCLRDYLVPAVEAISDKSSSSRCMVE